MSGKHHYRNDLLWYPQQYEEQKVKTSVYLYFFLNYMELTLIL